MYIYIYIYITRPPKHRCWRSAWSFQCSNASRAARLPALSLQRSYPYLTQSCFNVVLQRLMPPRICQLILYHY